MRNLFDRSRFPTSWPLLVLLVTYSPIGLVLLIVRTFLAAQVLLAATLLSHSTALRRYVLRIMSVVLGVVVREVGEVSPRSQLLVANHVTAIDALAAHLITGCTALWSSDVPSIVNTIMNFQRSPNQTILPPLTKEPILILPEGTTTNGKKGLLKFTLPTPTSPVLAQPMSLNVWRPPIASLNASTLTSGFWSDVAAILFAPVTVFTFRFLPVVNIENSGDSETLAPQIQQTIADDLKLQGTIYTAHDKRELVKQLRPPSPPVRTPPPPQQITHKTISQSSSDESSYCKQQSATASKQVSFGRTADERMRSYQDRKNDMLEQARKRYLEKNPVT